MDCIEAGVVYKNSMMFMAMVYQFRNVVVRDITRLYHDRSAKLTSYTTPRHEISRLYLLTHLELECAKSITKTSTKTFIHLAKICLHTKHFISSRWDRNHSRSMIS